MTRRRRPSARRSSGTAAPPRCSRASTAPADRRSSPPRSTRSGTPRAPSASISQPNTATCISPASCPIWRARTSWRVVERFLRRNHLERSDIDHWIVHPGGRRIIENVQTALELSSEDVATSWSALADHGNVGTPSILYVLKDTIERYAARAGRARPDGHDRPRGHGRPDASRLVSEPTATIVCGHHAHRRDPARQALRPSQAAPRRETVADSLRGRAGAGDGRRRARSPSARRRSIERTIVVTGEDSVAVRRAQAGRNGRRRTPPRRPERRGHPRRARQRLPRGSSACCASPATVPRSIRRSSTSLLAPGDDARDRSIIPDRHGTGTNGLLLSPARRDRAQLRPRQLRAPSRAGARRRARLPDRAPRVAAARHRHGDDLDVLRERLSSEQRGHRAPARCSGLATDAVASLSARSLSGLPEVRRGDDLAALISRGRATGRCTTARSWRSRTRSSPRPRARWSTLSDGDARRARARAGRGAGQGRARGAGRARSVRRDPARGERRADLPHPPRLRLRQRRRGRLQRVESGRSRGWREGRGCGCGGRRGRGWSRDARGPPPRPRRLRAAPARAPARADRRDASRC